MMNIFSLLPRMLTAPGGVFADIRDHRLNWIAPWLVLSVLAIVIGWLALPIQKAMLENGVVDLPAEQIDQQLDYLQRFGWIQLIFSPIIILVMSLVLSGIAYIPVSLMAQAANFKQFLTLGMCTGIVSTLGQLVATAIMRARGLDAIQSPEDAHISLSLRFLAGDGGSVLKGFLASFEFFTVWSCVLFVMGLVAVFGMRRGQAITAAIPMFILLIGGMIASEVFSNMAP
jgi:hypothetical protein